MNIDEIIENAQLKGRIIALEAELESEKAEVVRLMSQVSYDKRVELHVDKLAAEFTQSEVLTLTAEVRCLEAVIRSHERVDCLTVANLKAEVERLHSLIANREQS